MLTVAYIGFGNSVVRYHLPFIKHMSNVKIKWVYRREEDRALAGEKERELLYPELKFTTDLNEILNDPEVNLISINTHVDSHSFYAKAALNAGKHILVEKPFANSIEEAKAIFDLAKEKKLVCSCNNNRRFDADFRTLKKILDEKTLGDVVEIQSHYHYFRPVYRKKEAGAVMGMVSGLAIHPIDQMVYQFGTPDRIHYDVRGIFTEGGDDYIDIDFYYGQTKFTVKCSTCAKIDYPKFIAHGTKGSFIKNTQGHLSSQKKTEPVVVSFDSEDESNWGTLSYIDDKGQDITKKVQTEVTEYGKIYDNLDAVIQGKAELIVTEEQVLTVLRIVKEAEGSAR